MRTPLIAAFACISLAAGLIPAPRADAQYPPEAYSDAVNALMRAGVIDGSMSGDVRLYEYVNRAETLKVIIKAAPSLASQVAIAAANMPPISLFPDVDQRAWYAPYIEVGFRNGLVKGYPDGFYWPESGVKASEAAALLLRSTGNQNTDMPFLSSQDFPNATGQWYTTAVSYVLAHNGVMPGSRLRADTYLMRGQLFDMVYRTLFLKQSSSSEASVQPPAQIFVPQNPASSVPAQNYYNPVPVANAAQFASKKQFALTVPSIGLTDLTVTHPSDPTTQKGVLEVLKNGVGHLFSYPGEDGKILIYGHSSGYPWDLSEFTKIFRGINKITIGDRAYVTYQGKIHVYEVTSKQTVSASDMALLEPDDRGEQLVLYTCWPPDSITQRLLIMARPVETVSAR